MREREPHDFESSSSESAGQPWLRISLLAARPLPCTLVGWTEPTTNATCTAALDLSVPASGLACYTGSNGEEEGLPPEVSFKKYS